MTLEMRRGWEINTVIVAQQVLAIGIGECAIGCYACVVQVNRIWDQKRDYQSFSKKHIIDLQSPAPTML